LEDIKKDVTKVRLFIDQVEHFVAIVEQEWGYNPDQQWADYMVDPMNDLDEPVFGGSLTDFEKWCST
jgi:hypothetical protein